MRIVLASASPRRQEILRNMGISFEVITSNVNEKEVCCDFLENMPVEIAKLKANDISKGIKEDKIVIAADTIVIYKGKVLGKPKDKEEAFSMLNMLNGNECDIYTGLYVDVQVENVHKEYTDLSKCTVKFKELSNVEIENYIETKEPMDKAGAFAIQGIGAKFIQNIQGDFYAGVGMSINRLYEVLNLVKEDFNIDLDI